MNKIIKPFLISFVVLTIVVLVMGAFMSKTYEVQRSIEIQVPMKDAFLMVSDFSKWKDWSPWVEMEPTAHYETKGTMGSVGSVLLWDGKIVGAGTITMKDVQTQSVFMNLTIEKPSPMNAAIKITVEETPTSTKITWNQQGERGVIGRLFAKPLNQIVGQDIEKGLNNLKKKSSETLSSH